MRYTATAGSLALHDDHGRRSAEMFYISYVARGTGPIERRPVTFIYNGGPGVSSTGLNIGAFGPSVVSGLRLDHFDSPVHLVENPNSLLDKSDLVFIDAIGTGFSRVEGSAKGSDFFGIQEDADAFAQFIRRYVLLNGRSASPKYLMGVSYGTMRSAVVANVLEHAGIRLSGIVLMSTVLDFAALAGDDDQDLQFWLHVPTEAMIASYYGKNDLKDTDLERWLPKVRAFAAGPYAQALQRGDALSDADRRRVAEDLHAYIGISVADILHENLRVSADRFVGLLLAGQHEKIGLYDGRASVANVDASGHPFAADPSTAVAAAAFASASPTLVRDMLHYVGKGSYVPASLDVTQQWNWGEAGPSGADVTGELAAAIEADPQLRILSLNGYYDLRTPFFGTEYQLAHLGISRAMQRNIDVKYYRSGHMIFVDPKARAEMKHDIDAFYATGA